MACILYTFLKICTLGQQRSHFLVNSSVYTCEGKIVDRTCTVRVLYYVENGGKVPLTVRLKRKKHYY